MGRLKFRRQHPIGSYIVDFYCHEARLVVEIDGSVHGEPEQATRDAVRDDLLQSLGVRVLRVSNTDILQRLDATLARIHTACNSSISNRP